MTRRDRRPTSEVWDVLGLDTPPGVDMVDARPARAHARRLLDIGWGTRSLATRARVSRHTVQALVRGRTAADPPTRRMYRDAADRVLSIPLGEVPPCHRT